MSVFNCNIKFKKVVGDSYTSTTNKLISQGFIDKYNNIKDVGKFWTANTELSNEASAILGFDVRLYETPMRPTGRVAVPSIKYFKMIDQTIRERREVIPKIQSTPSINEFILNGEIYPTFEDAQSRLETNNEIDVKNSEISSSIRGELLQDSRRRSDNRNGIIGRGDELLPKTNTNTQNLVSGINENKKKEYFLENVEQLVSSISSRLTDQTNLNGRLFKQLGGSLDTTLVIQNHDHFIYVQKDKLYINQGALLKHLQDEIDEPNEYLDVLLFEELIHILTFSLTKNESIKRMAREQIALDSKFIKKVDEIYATNDPEEAYIEYIRIMVQDSITGKTTLAARKDWTQAALKFLEGLLKKIREVIQSTRTKELIDQHIEFINNLDTSIPIEEKIYKSIGKKKGSLIIPEDLKTVQKMIDEYNSNSSNIKNLELRETKLEGQYLIVNNYKSNYLFQPVEEIKEEKKVYASKEDSNSNFSVSCIIN